MNKKIYIKYPKQKIVDFIKCKKFIGKKLDIKILADYGIFILKNAINQNIITKYREKYFNDYKLKKIKKTKKHLTQVSINKNHYLTKIIKEKELIRITKNFFNGNVGCDFIRIVRKDKKNKNSLFTHQDTGYQVGGTTNKYSLFIALTECNQLNGGLNLYPGSHKFGYLGDVGEISKKITKNMPVVKSDLKPGDILFMDSNIWHNSPKNKNLTNRVYLEVHIQNADEPTSEIIIAGRKKNEWKFFGDKKNLFSNSRASRIENLNKKIDKLKKIINNPI